MAILPKSSGVVVTASAWAQSAKEKITPVIEKSKVVAVNTFNTTKAILDRYPPLKVPPSHPKLLINFNQHLGLCCITCSIFLDSSSLFPSICSF